MNRLPARAAASAALLVLLLLTSAAPVFASCMMPPSIQEAIKAADSVFVGTVMSVANRDRWATVGVEEVWTGPDLAPVVEIRGGPAGDAGTSVDRSFTGRTRYLFLAYIADGVLSDNACTSTTEWQPELANLRPPTARQPVSAAPQPDDTAPFDPASLVLPIALITAAGVVVFGAVLVLRRRA